MFRRSDGTPAAILDRCPHRFVPLSMGKRVDDTIQCGYHGLRFDGSGACVDAPHDDDSQKARACIKGYAVVERHKWIWIWMGEASEANPDLIPDFGFFDDTEKFTCCQGYTHMAGNYQLISDNLLDLSHIHYLHPGSARGIELRRLHQQGEARGRYGLFDAVPPPLSSSMLPSARCSAWVKGRRMWKARAIRAGMRRGSCLSTPRSGIMARPSMMAIARPMPI